MLPDIAIGLLLSGILSVIAYHRRSLTTSGAGGALVVGTAIYVGGGMGAWLTLLTFFLTATVLGRVGRAKKADTKDVFSKSDRRDVWQTLANGGVAAAAALAFHFSGGDVRWIGAFVGALAACNADTWATELGILSRREPWMITTGKRVPRGTSGGVSPRGTLATVAGGATIGVVAGLTLPPGIAIWAGIGAAAGFMGSLCDSLLGATAQVIYYCPACEKETERAQHACGTESTYMRGLRWLNNDWVNALASVAGGVVGATLIQSSGG